MAQIGPSESPEGAIICHTYLELPMGNTSTQLFPSHDQSLGVFHHLLQSFEKMIPNAQRVSHGRQSRIHRADAGEKASIDHVQVFQFMCLAVHIQGRRLRILPEAAGSGLVRYSGNRDDALHVGIAVGSGGRDACPGD